MMGKINLKPNYCLFYKTKDHMVKKELSFGDLSKTTISQLGLNQNMDILARFLSR